MTEDETGRLNRLESLVERQAQRIDDQQETIARQRKRIDKLEEDRAPDDDAALPTTNRRTALKAGGLLALLGVGAGTAAADPQGQVGTEVRPLEMVYTDALDGPLTSRTELTDLAGSGLGIDGGALGIATGGIGTDHLAAGTVTSTEIDLATIAGDDVTVDSSNGELDVSAASAWADADGDNLLEPTGSSVTGVDGVSTVQSPAGTGLTLYTDDGSRVMKLGVPGTDFDGNLAGGNVVAGHPNNTVADDIAGAVIGGGGSETDNENTVTGNYGTVGGGQSNTAQWDWTTVAGGRNNRAHRTGATVGGGTNNYAEGEHSTVAGGKDNTAENNYTTVGGGLNNTGDWRWATIAGGENNTVAAQHATIGGGQGNSAENNLATVGGGNSNTASGKWATVAGGDSNTVDNDQATVGGGFSNTASGRYATVPGGANNTADGTHSFAAGRGADTNGHDGAVVFGDSTDTEILADADDEAFFQMPVNGNFASTSSRAKKTAIEPVEPETVLSAVVSLEVSTWEYTENDDSRHMGPMAEEFATAFELGRSEKRINTVDADGVALAAIQGLSGKLDDVREDLEAKDERIETLESENERLRERVAAIEEQLAVEAGGDREVTAND